MKTRLKALIVILVLLCANISTAQDTLKISGKLLEVKFLREGSNSYLVYIERPDGAIMDMSIWERKIRKNRTGELAIVSQNWKNQNHEKSRKLYSLNDARNFMPIYHRSENGKGEIEAFDITSSQITGSDSVNNNSKKGFEMITDFEVFNFELDMEILSMLPFDHHITFSIPFYHPGSKTPPSFYNYNVLGKERITFKTGSNTCWKLRIEYSKANYATFWIDAKERTLIKMQEVHGPIRRYKILL